MSWKTLILLTGSDSPVVVVLSGSMEPAFYRGDILFLNMGTAPLRTGEIVVYNAEEDTSIPVVHRIIEVHERQDSEYIDILTKVSSCGCTTATRVPRFVVVHRNVTGGITLESLPADHGRALYYCTYGYPATCVHFSTPGPRPN